MTQPLRTLLAASVLAMLATSAAANPGEKASTVADKASNVAVKVEGAVKKGVTTAASAVGRGVKTAASAVDRGASAASRAIENTARRIGLPASSGAPGPSSPSGPRQ
ncbi:MAG: hypothetical protein Tsb007_45780 [Rhizobacter sp.]